MTAGISPFSPDLLNNPFVLRRFFSGEEEVQQILQQPPLEPRGRDGLYFGPGRVVWILVKAPFEWLLSLFLEAVASCLYWFGFERGYNFLMVASQQLQRDYKQLKAQEVFKQRLLVPCSGVHQFSTWDVYCTTSRPVSFITDPEMQELTWPKAFDRYNEPYLEGVDTLKFAHLEGACRTSVYWFAHLFFRTEGRFTNEKDHFLAVARQFETGFPRQAAVLMNFSLEEAALHFFQIRSPTLGEATISVEALQKKELSADNIKKITDLSPGLYRISMELHSMLYYKCSDTISYWWSPWNDGGVIEIGADVQFLLSTLFKEVPQNTKDPLTIMRLFPVSVQQQEQVAAAATG
jgi:hypothetical protein